MSDKSWAQQMQQLHANMSVRGNPFNSVRGNPFNGFIPNKVPIMTYEVRWDEVTERHVIRLDYHTAVFGNYIPVRSNVNV